jgi:hypothetical protein
MITLVYPQLTLVSFGNALIKNQTKTSRSGERTFRIRGIVEAACVDGIETNTLRYSQKTPVGFGRDMGWMVPNVIASPDECRGVAI